MSKPVQDPVSRIPGVRASLTEVAVLAIILAFAVNLLTDAFESSTPMAVSVGVGAALALGSIGYVIWTRLRTVAIETKIAGFIVFDRGANILVEVPEYDLAEDAVRYLKAAFAENPALRRQWDAEPLLSNRRSSIREYNQADRLLLELLEYIALHRLSMALSGHFNSTDFENAKLRTYQRADIPDILLKNRFLELFSRNISDRVGFDAIAQKSSDEGWVLVATSSPEGAHYNRFELTLPADSKISRTSDGKLAIEGPSVSLTLEIDYRGMHANAPFELTRLYLGKESIGVSPVAVDFYLCTSVKRQLFLRSEAIRYNAWVEKALRDLSESLSGPAFIDRIQWPLIQAMVQVFKADRMPSIKTSSQHFKEEGEG